MPMANGFYLNEPACRQIHEEERAVRHSRNSSVVNPGDFRQQVCVFLATPD
jgi:hypothetical protein